MGKAFQDSLLNSVLAREDLASLAPESCETLRFALKVRDSRAKDYPAFRDQELEEARLWLPLFKASNRPRQQAPVLERLDQFPIAVIYGRHMQSFHQTRPTDSGAIGYG